MGGQEGEGSEGERKRGILVKLFHLSHIYSVSSPLTVSPRATQCPVT